MFRVKKVMGIAVAAVLCITAIMGTLVIFAQERAEQGAEARQGLKIVGEEATGDGDDPDGSVHESRLDRLYKDVHSYVDEDILKALCENYDLDYETVTMSDITPEMVDYEMALWLKKEMENRPVLGDTGWGDPELSTLEIQVNDIHAFYGSKPIIEEVCRQAGIDPETAVIGDLSLEQLQSIMAMAFETSDHGE